MRNIPFSPPDITDFEVAEVVEALKSGWITTGKRTKLFEQKIGEFCGTDRAVCLNSASAALKMTLRLLEIGEGDEVIVPAYTYTASASVVNHVGAKIVFADAFKDTFEIDYDSIEGLINEKTKAIISVDLGGRMCDYDRIFNSVLNKRDLFTPSNELQSAFGRVIVIADAAHSLGARYKGKNSGQVADFTCFSFHAVKNLTTGEGGAVTWKKIDGVDDAVLYNKYMLLSLHGQDKDAFHKNQLGSWEYDIAIPGYKCNMTDIAAAIGLKQLERYEGLLRRREEIIRKYDAALLPLGVKRLVHYDENSRSSGHLYLVRVDGIDEKGRNDIIIKMAEKGIVCNVHYKPLPMMTAYKNLGFDIKDFPNAYNQYKNEFTLPLHTCLTDEDVRYIIESICEILK